MHASRVQLERWVVQLFRVPISMCTMSKRLGMKSTSKNTDASFCKVEKSLLHTNYAVFSHECRFYKLEGHILGAVTCHLSLWRTMERTVLHGTLVISTCMHGSNLSLLVVLTLHVVHELVVAQFDPKKRTSCLLMLLWCLPYQLTLGSKSVESWNYERFSFKVSSYCLPDLCCIMQTHTSYIYGYTVTMLCSATSPWPSLRTQDGTKWTTRS